MTVFKKFIALVLIITVGLVTSCGNQPGSTEERARQHVLTEIKESNEAIEEYLKILEEQYAELLEVKIAELDKAVKKLRFDYGSYTTSHRVEKKSELLEQHKELLHKKFAELKKAYGEDFKGENGKIDELFEEVDEHISLLDSLMADI